MAPTIHAYLKALLVFSGEGTLRGSGWSRALAVGDVAVVPPGCEHWIEDRSPLSLYVLCFRAEDFSTGWAELIRGLGKPKVWAGTGAEMLELARRLLHEQAAPRQAGEAMARGLGWQMLAVLTRAPATAAKPLASGDPTGSRARVEEAARELRHRFFEPLRIDEEAKRAGLGRRRFTQLFLEVKGRTWWEELNAVRIAHAELLLRETERSVAAVAFECGYGDLSGFYRAWSAGHGSSPQAWRQAPET